jgi:glycosyltransferase involved in cell wall biosynthesis
MHTTAIAAEPVAPTREHRDAILALGYTSWAGAARRGWVHPQDRLAQELASSERLDRLLLCNPFRSLPLKLVRRVIGPPEEEFPASEARVLYEPLRIRRSDPRGISALERSCASLERRLRRVASERGLRRPAVITDHPPLAGFGRFDWSGPVTYYATDDLIADPPLKPAWLPAFRAAFAGIRESSRRVVAVTSGALRSVGTDGPSAVVPNGIEPTEWLAPPQAPRWFLELPRPRLLYVGTLDGRIDAEAVAAIAAAFPHGSIALVGRETGERSIAELAPLPNLTIRPSVERRQLPGLVAAADAGLVPHVHNSQTETMSPLKLYEYLAAGRPGAATDLPGISSVCPERTCLGPPGDGQLEAVRAALALGPWAEPQRRTFIRQQSWSRRFQQLLDVALRPESHELAVFQPSKTRSAGTM